MSEIIESMLWLTVCLILVIAILDFSVHLVLRRIERKVDALIEEVLDIKSKKRLGPRYAP